MFIKGKLGFMQINLELSTPLIHLICFTIVLVCEYFKNTHGFALAIQMPDFEEEQQYPDDGQQDVYDN
jgi:hypothetical protein